MWQSVICCLLAGLMIVDSRLVWRDERLDATHPRCAVFSSAPGCYFHWPPAARWSRFRSSQAPLARWSAGCKILVPAYWRGFRQCLPQTGQGSLGLSDDPYGIADPGVLAAAGVTDIASGADGLTFPSPGVLPGVSHSGAIIALSRDSCAGRHAPSSPS